MVFRGGSAGCQQFGSRAKLKKGKPVRLCPCSSDVDLFGYGESVVDLNAEIYDSALDLGMTQ